MHSLTTSYNILPIHRNRSDMLPDNGRIPFRTTDLRFCSDSSEVIFTIPLLAPVSHHHRLALPFYGKVTLFVNAFLIYRYYISHFFELSSRMLQTVASFLAFLPFFAYNIFKYLLCTDFIGRGRETYGHYTKKKRR